MALFLLEDRDFKDFWMKIWNAGVSVITRSTFSSLLFTLFVVAYVYWYLTHSVLWFCFFFFVLFLWIILLFIAPWFSVTFIGEIIVYIIAL